MQVSTTHKYFFFHAVCLLEDQGLSKITNKREFICWTDVAKLCMICNTSTVAGSKHFISQYFKNKVYIHTSQGRIQAPIIYSCSDHFSVDCSCEPIEKCHHISTWKRYLTNYMSYAVHDLNQIVYFQFHPSNQDFSG